MQLSPPPRIDADATDLASAIRAATAAIGAAPAVTVLFPEGRQEQGMASLAQWAAKGAHLLEAELLLRPGEDLHLAAPLSWTSVAVVYAAWWAGISVTLDGEAEVAVVHQDRLADAPAGADLLVLGDRLDGAPEGEVTAEPWVRAVQSFPDQPPPPQAAADLVALRAGGRSWTQHDLLAEARALAPDARTVGVDATDAAPVAGLIAVAVRPLVRYRPTVVLRGVPRSAAAGDQVTAWL